MLCQSTFRLNKGFGNITLLFMYNLFIIYPTKLAKSELCKVPIMPLESFIKHFDLSNSEEN